MASPYKTISQFSCLTISLPCYISPMTEREITNKILKHLESVSNDVKTRMYDDVYADAAVFGSSFLKFNPDTMTFELVPRDEIYKTAWGKEEEETKTPLPPAEKQRK